MISAKIMCYERNACEQLIVNNIIFLNRPEKFYPLLKKY